MQLPLTGGTVEPFSEEADCFHAVASAASLDALLTLLSDANAAPGGWDFHSRICAAIGSIAHLDRVALVVPGCRGRGEIAGLWGMSADAAIGLAPTPVVMRELLAAARRSPVVTIGEGGDLPLPRRYASRLATEALVCVPVFAHSRLVALLFGDRAGGRPLSADDRRAAWLAGKLTAVVLTAHERASREQRAMRMSEWLDVGRRIHERVIQRLAGVSMVMGTERALTSSDYTRARVEIGTALDELREHIQMPLSQTLDEAGYDLRGKLLALTRAATGPAVVTRWDDGVEVPPRLEPLVAHFLDETLANARKHARATAIEVSVSQPGSIVVEVANDGVRGQNVGPRGCGQRLLAAEALMHGCRTDFRRDGQDRWRARLAMPPEGEA